MAFDRSNEVIGEDLMSLLIEEPLLITEGSVGFLIQEALGRTCVAPKRFYQSTNSPKKYNILCENFHVFMVHFVLLFSCFYSSFVLNMTSFPMFSYLQGIVRLCEKDFAQPIITTIFLSSPQYGMVTT